MGPHPHDLPPRARNSLARARRNIATPVCLVQRAQRRAPVRAGSTRSPIVADSGPMRGCRSRDRCPASPRHRRRLESIRLMAAAPSAIFAACSASIGRSPTLSSAIRASAQRPFSSSCTSGSRADQRKIPVPSSKFPERRIRCASPRRNTNLRQQLARLDGCREQPDEKLIGRQLAGPGLAAAHQASHSA